MISLRPLHKNSLVGILCVFLVSACATNPTTRFNTLISQQLPDFIPVNFGQHPVIHGALKTSTKATSPLWIVIEGDGQSWLTKYIPSRDPTPNNPAGARLASQISGDRHILYLSRPCQYLSYDELSDCQRSDWTEARFSPKWINRVNLAINYAKNEVHAQQIVLTGYSGGGYLATVLATQRQDIMALITIAAPLNINAWTHYHHVSPLIGSVDITANKATLYTLPQIHLVGGDDKVVPVSLTTAFLSSYPKNAPAELQVLPGVTHDLHTTIDLSQIRSSSWSSPIPDAQNSGL